MRQALRPDDYAAAELRETLAHGGVLPKRPATQLLPPLVDILLEERDLYRQRRRQGYQITVGSVAFLLIACVTFTLSADLLLAVLIDLLIAAYAVWLGLQTDERDRTGAVTHREERTQRERLLTLRSPLTPLHRQALDSLAEMLRGSWRDTATRETLPDLVRLANALERSVVSGERRLARAAGSAIKALLPHLTGGDPLRDPAVLTFLRERVAAGIAPLPGAEGAFNLSPHRAAAVSSVYDWDFVVAALLVLGEAGDDATVPIAENLSRHHPFEKVRVAAEECLRAHLRTGR